MILLVVRDGQVADTFRGTTAGLERWLKDNQFIATDDCDNPAGVIGTYANDEGETAIILQTSKIIEKMAFEPTEFDNGYNQGYQEAYGELQDALESE